jgi:hypothetical protein
MVSMLQQEWPVVLRVSWTATRVHPASLHSLSAGPGTIASRMIGRMGVHIIRERLIVDPAGRRWPSMQLWHKIWIVRGRRTIVAIVRRTASTPATEEALNEWPKHTPNPSACYIWGCAIMPIIIDHGKWVVVHVGILIETLGILQVPIRYRHRNIAPIRALESSH